MASLSRFAVHTMTNKPWTLEECCRAYSEAGFGGLGVWRDVVEPIGVHKAASLISEYGLEVPSLVRGGFFVSSNASERFAAIDENKRCLDEAAVIGADHVVLVVGAEPGLSLDEARCQVRDGIEACVEHAKSVGVRLAIEPLHPMYAADKSCINRIGDARAMCDSIDHPFVGVALDVYHTWWDVDLKAEIAELGRSGQLFAFHVCDWRVPTRHLLTDRTVMGDGCIDVPTITQWVFEAGFQGLIEIEIFSEEHWAEDQMAYLERIAFAAPKCISQPADSG